MTRSVAALALLAVLAAMETVFAQGGIPLGPEFQVNTYFFSRQERSAVASDSAGNFLVTWESFSQDGGSAGPGVPRQHHHHLLAAPAGGGCRS